MRNECIDVRSFETITAKQLLADFSLLAHGKLKDLLPILMDVVHFLVDRLMGGGMETAAGRHVEGAGAGAIDFMDEIDQAHRLVFRGLENGGSGPVAKNHAGSSVRVVDDRRHNVSADHHDALVRTGGDELCSGLERIQEGRAGGRKIKSPRSLGTQLGLYKAGSGGKQHVGGDGSYNDGVQIARRHAALRQRFLCGLDGKVTGGNTFVDNVAFADANARGDPFIRRADHFLEVGVGEKTRRDGSTEGADLDCDRGSGAYRAGQ